MSPLRQAREDRGLSQEALAKRCRTLFPKAARGVSARAIGFWESAQRTPSAPQFAVLVGALDVPATTLLDLVQALRAA